MGSIRSVDVGDIVMSAALPLSTQLAAISGSGTAETEQARRDEGPVTPAGGAFAIWAPIFASLFAYAGLKSADPAMRDDLAEGLARTSLLASILWNLNAQFRNLGWASFGLISAAALSAVGTVARYEALALRGRSIKLAGTLFAPLAGWLSVATFANLDTTLRVEGSSGADVLTPSRIVGLASLASLVGIIVTRANYAYVAAAGWGLAGIAIKNRKKAPSVTNAALVGLASAVILTVALGRGRGKT